MSIVSSGGHQHFPGQTLRRNLVDKWNKVAVLENMRHGWHRWKQNPKVDWSQMKQGENQSREHGVGVEVDVLGRWVVVGSRLDLGQGHPCVEVVQSCITQKPQPVDEDRGNKVDPSPSPVHCQTLPCNNNFFDLIFVSLSIDTS